MYLWLMWSAVAGAQFVMLGSGDAAYENAMRAAEAAHPASFRGWVGFSVPVAHRIIAGAHLHCSSPSSMMFQRMLPPSADPNLNGAFSKRMLFRCVRACAGCDILLMPSRFEPCGLNQLFAMRYGTIPIAHATGGLRDTIQDYSPYAEGLPHLLHPYVHRL